MRKEEIMNHLKEGAQIKEFTSLCVKYGRIKRGASIRYSINDTTITKAQFDVLKEHLEVRESPLPLIRYWKLKNNVNESPNKEIAENPK